LRDGHPHDQDIDRMVRQEAVDDDRLMIGPVSGLRRIHHVDRRSPRWGVESSLQHTGPDLLVLDARSEPLGVAHDQNHRPGPVVLRSTMALPVHGDGRGSHRHVSQPEKAPLARSHPRIELAVRLELETGQHDRQPQVSFAQRQRQHEGEEYQAPARPEVAEDLPRPRETRVWSHVRTGNR
jgi:hypothetical protein